MAEPFQIPGLAKLREEIDEVDSALLTLLNRRAGLSLAVGQAKRQVGGKVFDPAREALLLERLAGRNEGPLKAEHVTSIWRAILSASRSLQKNCSVAYLGPEGTFSYFAAVDFMGEAMEFTPCRDFNEIFRGIMLKQFDFGVIPLENSIHGTIAQSFDLFSEHEVSIQAEFYSRIANSLLSRETSLDEVTIVYSHPQPLGQCASWLRAHLPTAGLVPVESTAAAARRAVDPGTAAIGNGKLAAMTGLGILARRIEDEPGNWTRFVIIGPKPARAQLGGAVNTPVPGHTGADKTSLLFTLPDKAGSLCTVLNLLASHHINMRKLESRPLRGQCWKYAFFADVECDLEAPQYADALQKLAEACTSFRILGCYPTGPQLDRTDAADQPEEARHV